MMDTDIGLIGLGVMGRSMARNLLRGGFSLHVNTRTPEKAKELISEGAVWHDRIGTIATKCQLVMTILGDPEDVKSIYMGEHGLLNLSQKDSILVDMTTSSPELAIKLNKLGQQNGIHVLDAPVSGGDIGARNASLSIMVGGNQEAFVKILPILRTIGSNIVYQGPAGNGQHTKMVNQICIAAGKLAVCEGLIYGQAVGLDLKNVLNSIESGAAGSWTLSNLGPRMLKGDFDPGFFIKHFVKDLRIAKKVADVKELTMPGLKLALELYEAMIADGDGDLGTQALFKKMKSLSHTLDDPSLD